MSLDSTWYSESMVFSYSVTVCDKAYLKALARCGKRCPVSAKRRRHWLNRITNGMSVSKGINIFLYKVVRDHRCFPASSISWSKSQSPDSAKPRVHAQSWKTLTIDVKMSPTYPSKNVGDVRGAVTTPQTVDHINFRVRQGRSKLHMVYRTKMRGKIPAGARSGMACPPAL